ncbi:MAG: NADH-quinone oxidoreductase subunit J family protein [Candidatus Thorarchaeota archaeon]|jgi:NADH:ubiquinone oxidoreductase subunit 6 (subunit J)
MQGFESAFESVEFLLIAGIVIVLAYLALEHREIVYAAFFFGIMASFVAGFFLLLEAPFVAGMQIAVYTGGISALIIFGVLLLPRAQDSTLETIESPRAKKIGILVSGSIMFLSAILALTFPWNETIPEGTIDASNNVALLAEWLWGDHGIYVQLIALIIVTSLVGVIALMRMDKAELMKGIVGEFGIEAKPEPKGLEPEPEEVPEPEESLESEETSETEVSEEVAD